MKQVGLGLRRYKALSAAVLAGCSQHPSAGGALRAAWRATFPKVGRRAPFNAAKLREAYPELAEPYGISCPNEPNTVCLGSPRGPHRTIEQAIIHLEAVHRRSREDVARWLAAHGY